MGILLNRHVFFPSALG